MRAAPFISLATWCVLTAPIAAQEPRSVPRVLLDRQMRERAVMLTALDARTISYTDAAGLVRSEPVSEYLALIPPTEAPAKPASTAGPRTGEGEAVTARAWSVIDLTDGERFFGDVGPGAPGRDALRWVHPVLGPMEFKIDQVRRVRLDMPPAGSWTKPVPLAPADSREDVVVFANGDRASGFVEGISGEPRELSLAPKDKGAARSIDLGVVREVVFANPGQLLPARATLVWLRDGSVIACRAIGTTRLGEVTLQPAMQDTEAAASENAPETKTQGLLRLDDLLGVAFEPALLAPLSGLPPVSQAPVGDRRWTKPIAIANADRAVLGAGDIERPGPLNVEWDLPPGASRLGATAELPRQMWTWGDCQVVVSAVGSPQTELFRARLNADQPQARIAVALNGAKRLSIRVEAGQFGPIQDRVILRRPVLLVEKK